MFLGMPKPSGCSPEFKIITIQNPAAAETGWPGLRLFRRYILELVPKLGWFWTSPWKKQLFGRFFL
jgi:hypothetical protein